MGWGRGAGRLHFCSKHFSSALHLHSASNMVVPVEMDCCQPDRFATVVFCVLGLIPVFLIVALS